MPYFRKVLTVPLLSMALSVTVAAGTLSDIDRYKAVLHTFPEHVPTALTTDAPLAGNGDIGLTMAPSAGKLTFYVGKNDFWRAVESYPDGLIALPGGLTFTSDCFREEGYEAEQLPGSAEIRARFDGLRLRAWVPAIANRIILELSAERETRLHLDLWTPDGLDCETEQGVEAGCAWVHRAFRNRPYLEWPTEMALAMNHPGGDLVLAPGERRVIILAICTNHETEKWHREALQGVSGVTEQYVEALREMHRSWWEGFWNLSEVHFDDPFLEQYYYQSQYLFACASREGKWAPGLWGPFITADNAAWAGDYHLNYNYQGPYWACFSSNHIGLTENYDQPLLDYMDRGRSHARNLTGCRGILYPVGLGPKGLCTSAWPKDPERMAAWYGGASPDIEDGAMFWKQKTNASFGAANMLMRFYSTYDAAYARKIYPYILACAEFWEDYLKEEDGRYVVRGDVFHETPPWSDFLEDYNCTVSLGMARMVFLGADALSRFLRKDKVRRARWQEILSRLSDYPDLNVPERFHRIHMHGILLPTGLTGPVSTPGLNARMLKELNARKAENGKDWGDTMGNGIETVYPGAARIGYPARELLEHLRDRIRKGAYPNGYIHAAGGGLETLSAVPLTINEMMLQSYEGVLRIFPNWDPEMDGSFRNLRAYGAFLVSAAFRDGKVREVSLTSEKGRQCTIQNPWPGTAVRVFRNGRPWKTFREECFTFSTRSGASYEFRPV